MMKTPFDLINNVMASKEYNFNKENENFYNPFLTNRACSYFYDTVLFGNEMNKSYSLPKNMQYDFYFYGLDKRKRYSKWHKIDEEQELVLAICFYYNYTRTKARQIIPILKKSDREYLLKVYKRKKDVK